MSNKLIFMVSSGEGNRRITINSLKRVYDSVQNIDEGCNFRGIEPYLFYATPNDLAAAKAVMRSLEDGGRGFKRKDIDSMNPMNAFELGLENADESMDSVQYDLVTHRNRLLNASRTFLRVMNYGITRSAPIGIISAGSRVMEDVSIALINSGREQLAVGSILSSGGRWEEGEVGYVKAEYDPESAFPESLSFYRVKGEKGDITRTRYDIYPNNMAAWVTPRSIEV